MHIHHVLVYDQWNNIQKYFIVRSASKLLWQYEIILKICKNVQNDEFQWSLFSFCRVVTQYYWYESTVLLLLLWKLLTVRSGYTTFVLLRCIFGRLVTLFLKTADYGRHHFIRRSQDEEKFLNALEKIENYAPEEIEVYKQST